MADRGCGEGDGPVVRLVAPVFGVAGGWWMGWVKMNFVASWGRARRGCKGLGSGLDGERLRRRGVGWKMVGGGPGGKYGGDLFCIIIGG